jgi:hypothetical protein
LEGSLTGKFGQGSLIIGKRGKRVPLIQIEGSWIDHKFFTGRIVDKKANKTLVIFRIYQRSRSSVIQMNRLKRATRTAATIMIRMWKPWKFASRPIQ